MSSDLEQTFITRYKQLGAGYDLTEEHRFHETRKWRFDYAHISSKTAIELEGGVYNRGRHTRGKGFENDCEKYNAAVVNGWVILRYTSNMLDSDPATCIEQIDNVIAVRLPDTDAKEGDDITLAEPITVAAIEPEVVSVDVATTEPAAQPDIKLLPAHIPHPYAKAKELFINGYGQRAYEVKATGWLSGRATVTLNIGTGDAINWTVFADRVSIENPFIKKATEDIAA